MNFVQEIDDTSNPLAQPPVVKICVSKCFKDCSGSVQLTKVNGENGYETRESSLLYVSVLFIGLDRAQNTIVVYSLLRSS